MLFNNQSPPVSTAHIEAAGLCCVIGVERIYVSKNGVVVGAFDDVEWGHGASGTLFINHVPITDRPVPALKNIVGKFTSAKSQ